MTHPPTPAASLLHKAASLRPPRPTGRILGRDASGRPAGSGRHEGAGGGNIGVPADETAVVTRAGRTLDAAAADGAQRAAAAGQQLGRARLARGLGHAVGDG